MLIKALALAAVFFVIYIMFFKKSNKEVQSNRKKSKKQAPKGDVMMECEKCETFVSEDEAIIKDGKFYCSKKCAGVK
ncbi:MAG TPA: Prokaryotic metallothionein [Sulfurospirillum arcachonense]|nr:Prokaryotic metallothionein [Sulfurospirillum arcachonense]HIP44194.1 Prokaryotic metallothionein [Sulfurospirillum arcachonense]